LGRKIPGVFGKFPGHQNPFMGKNWVGKKMMGREAPNPNGEKRVGRILYVLMTKINKLKEMKGVQARLPFIMRLN